MGPYSLTEETVVFHAESIIGKRGRQSIERFRIRFHDSFGCSIFFARKLWKRIMKFKNGQIMRGACFKHLLWALFFINHYGKEAAMKSVIHHDEKTIRKWTWYFINALADLVPSVVSSLVYLSLLLLFDC